jgi:hypothetical protein
MRLEKTPREVIVEQTDQILFFAFAGCTLGAAGSLTSTRSLPLLASFHGPRHREPVDSSAVTTPSGQEGDRSSVHPRFADRQRLPARRQGPVEHLERLGQPKRRVTYDPVSIDLGRNNPFVSPAPTYAS